MQLLFVGTIRSLVPHRTSVWDFSSVESDFLGRHPDSAPWPDNKRHFASHCQDTLKTPELFFVTKLTGQLKCLWGMKEGGTPQRPSPALLHPNPKPVFSFSRSEKKNYTPGNSTKSLDGIDGILTLSLDYYLVAIFLILCQMNSSKSACSYTFDQRVVIHNTQNV